MKRRDGGLPLIPHAVKLPGRRLGDAPPVS